MREGLVHLVAGDTSNEQTLEILLDDAQTDAERMERLLPLVYDQLRAVAEMALATERPDHTLQATALVHEAYLRLVGERTVPWSGKAHFYVAAAEAMRRILLDHARRRVRLKRGGGRARVDLQGVADLAAGDASEIVEFDAMFERLECQHPEAAAVVRLRFYAGLTIEQTAKALELSPNTVDRRWALARAWLFRATNERSGDE